MKHEAIKLKLKLNYYCLIEAFSISTFFHSHLIQLTYKKKWAFWNIKLNSTYPFSRIEVKLIWKRKWVDEIDVTFALLCLILEKQMKWYLDEKGETEQDKKHKRERCFWLGTERVR